MAVTKNISLDYQDVIVIGRRGENEAVDIVWDISPLVAEFGGGTALVLAKRATDESAYPVTLTEQTDTTLTWTVSSVDSCVIGVGKVQLFWYVGNVLAKSFMWRTFVGDDITGMVGDPPEAYESWLEHLAEMGADILNDAKDEVKNAEAWAVGERGGEPVVDGDETYHNNSKYWSGVSSDYAGNAESSADAAEQSAGDAAHQVELAEAQVTLAEGQVALAQQKVQDAAAQVALATAQAQAAAGSASDASGYALAASGYASDANTYKGQAYTSAQNAAQKASDAAGYALAASGSAADANTYKGQAQGFANAASGYADNASTYANNASGYADAASDFADAAAASATEAAGYVASLVNGKAGVLEDSASGDVVSIVPDKSVGKLYKAEVSLSPIQSLNGYDHPWAAGAGKNKLDTSTTTAEAGTFIQGADGYVTASPTNSDTRTWGYSSAQYKLTLPAGSYKFVWQTKTPGANTGAMGYRVFNSSGTVLADAYGATLNTSGASSVFTLSAQTDIGVMVKQYDLVARFMLIASNESTDWSPYSNLCPITGHTGATLNIGTEYPTADREYPVTFGQTVYGGTFDFASGKLVVTHAGKLGSEFTWQYNATYKIGYTYMAGKKPGRTNIISSAYKTVDKPYSAMLNGEISGALDTGVNVKDDSTSTLAEFQAAVANVQFVYELATPIEIDLDPTEVQTLLGLNNVWSDGEMSVDYAADLKTYIDNKIAAAVAALS